MGSNNSRQHREKHMRWLARRMIKKHGTPFVSRQELMRFGGCSGQKDVDEYFEYINRIYDNDNQVFLEFNDEVFNDADIDPVFFQHSDDFFGSSGGFNNNTWGNQGGFGNQQGGFGSGGFSNNNQGGFGQGGF